jgi:siroheme synthase (precorrin-2 oxidase/ferrochelatase)
VQKEIYEDENTDDDESYDEDAKLLKPIATSSEFSSIFEQHRRSSETVFDVRSLKNPFDDDELEDDATFVVNAINDSHESLRKLVSE